MTTTARGWTNQSPFRELRVIELKASCGKEGMKEREVFG